VRPRIRELTPRARNWLDCVRRVLSCALQRAHATLAARNVGAGHPSPPLREADRALLVRYVEAFERYDMEALTSLIHEDATQSMPPYELWLSGRGDILRWWFGPGIGCGGSRVLPTSTANGSPAFAQYKPAPGGSHERQQSAATDELGLTPRSKPVVRKHGRSKGTNPDDRG